MLLSIVDHGLVVFIDHYFVWNLCCFSLNQVSLFILKNDVFLVGRLLEKEVLNCSLLELEFVISVDNSSFNHFNLSICLFGELFLHAGWLIVFIFDDELSLLSIEHVGENF